MGFSCQDCGQGERFVPGGLLLFLCYGLVGAWSCLLWAPLVPFGEGWLVGGTKLWCRGVESVVITQFACLGSGGRWAPILRQWQLGPVGLARGRLRRGGSGHCGSGGGFPAHPSAGWSGWWMTTVRTGAGNRSQGCARCSRGLGCGGVPGWRRTTVQAPGNDANKNFPRNPLGIRGKLVGWLTGLEPATSWTTTRRSAN